MQVATTPSFPEGLILVETGASGKTRTWHAQNLADAINKCNAAAIQARRGDESEEWEAVTDLAALKTLLGRDLYELDVYTVADAADMIGAEAQGSALALGWIERTEDAVRATKTLDDLAAALNAYVAGSQDERLEDVVDLCDLPTFGGDAPADTREIWSWDAARLLRHDGQRYVIEARKLSV